MCDLHPATSTQGILNSRRTRHGPGAILDVRRARHGPGAVPGP